MLISKEAIDIHDCKRVTRDHLCIPLIVFSDVRNPTCYFENCALLLLVGGDLIVVVNVIKRFNTVRQILPLRSCSMSS